MLSSHKKAKSSIHPQGWVPIENPKRRIVAYSVSYTCVAGLCKSHPLARWERGRG